MKKAFTMIELIIVIVVVGILSAAILPRMKTDDVGAAAEQVMGHIRYTQHLAMSNNLYIPDSNMSKYTNANQKMKSTRYWFKGNWQIQFHTSAKNFGYSIYSDHPTDTLNAKYSSDPEIGDVVARDPLTKLFLIADVNSLGTMKDERATDVDLLSKYNVSLDMSKCFYATGDTGTSKHLVFDRKGRPHCAESSNNLTDDNPTERLMTQQVKLRLYSDTDSLTICVEPYSGYLHFCS